MDTINYETFNEFMDTLRLIILKCAIDDQDEPISQGMAKEIANATKKYGIELLDVLGINFVEL